MDFGGDGIPSASWSARYRRCCGPPEPNTQETRRHRREVALVAINDAKQRSDGGLVRRDAVEVAHLGMLRLDQCEIDHVQPAQNTVDDRAEDRFIGGVADGDSERAAKAYAVSCPLIVPRSSGFPCNVVPSSSFSGPDSSDCRDSRAPEATKSGKVCLFRKDQFWLLGSAFKVLTAFRIGSGEIRTLPPKPCSNSRNIATAPATASAHKAKVTAAAELRGANKPKLANSSASQTTRRATNAFGVPCRVYLQSWMKSP